MKKQIKLYLSILLILVFGACSDNEIDIVDPIYQFVAFENYDVVLNEAGNSETAFETNAKLLVHETYDTDIEITFQVNGINCEENVDFKVEPASGKLIIKAGEYNSDSIRILTINNDEISTLPRTIEVAITEISQADINIGLGLTDIKGDKIVATLADDDILAKGVQVFNNTLNCSSIGGSGYGGTNSITGTVDGNELTISGNLINYSSFPAQSMNVTFVPDDAESTSGKISFAEQTVGTDNDGYVYQYRPTGENGTYDVNTGEVRFKIWIYYESGGSWAYWYEDELLVTLP